MSKEHFKTLYEIAKEQGPVAALKHDAVKTALRHPNITFAVMDLFAGAYEQHKNIKLDTGFAEATLGTDGEIVRIRYREANSDVTTVSERGPDGKWDEYSLIPTKGKNGG